MQSFRFGKTRVPATAILTITDMGPNGYGAMSNHNIWQIVLINGITTFEVDASDTVFHELKEYFDL